MKALWHAECGSIVTPPVDGWTACRCGQYACRWRDSTAGLFEVASRGGRQARVIGFHNQYVLAGYRSSLTDEDWKKVLTSVLDRTPDTYLFVRRGSPMVVLAPGESNDTFWMPWPEVFTAVEHQAGCCSSRGCHDVCSHLCGTDLAVGTPTGPPWGPG